MKNKYRALAITSAMIMAFTAAPMTALAETEAVVYPDENDDFAYAEEFLSENDDFAYEEEMIKSNDGEDFEEDTFYTIEVMYSGADKIVVVHDTIADDFFQIPENDISEKEDYEFTGYYCPQTGKTYQTGDYIAISDFEAFSDELGYFSYNISLIAQFKQIQAEQPDVVYTDKAVYDFCVEIVSPADYDTTISQISGSTEDIFEPVGTVAVPRTLTRGFYQKYQLDGFRSLTTGKVFTPNEALFITDLPTPAAGEAYLQNISETEGLKITPYTIHDTLVPVFSFYGVSGAYQDINLNCEIDYYRSESFTDAADLNAPAVYLNTEYVTVAMADEADGIILTTPEEVPGYIFTGYGPMDGTEAIYTDGIVYLDDCAEWNNGNLRFSVKAYYEVDESYVPEVVPEEPQEDPAKKDFKNLGQEIKYLNQTLKGDKEALSAGKDLAKAEKKAEKPKK